MPLFFYLAFHPPSIKNSDPVQYAESFESKNFINPDISFFSIILAIGRSFAYIVLNDLDCLLLIPPGTIQLILKLGA